mmetsp:Transcript_32474/g.63444  ORF Transcript_32474/g.63444 Transcript_32474/m.63444 type:complete len:279 (-) Transcript_32474:353-1189(-)|eukprot:CAMPEP_0173384116 /NCGR_PEP_ID=MMETSP1356-20130122/6684_1 /TAXON_ID=77927 ORGANISM="Hemiselmis virescens, Strain PCC157" /NCGR_SAMPLE_ID=MMETSP1356 /ASSEMBLY_ACC=CAM_ASM_000847 /LENGTH=278 /DNA_ID=CAMNT_0014339309 /DNA_START=72 /DNA_END=908 /DNA_ORIENTATION=-
MIRTSLAVTVLAASANAFGLSPSAPGFGLRSDTSAFPAHQARSHARAALDGLVCSHAADETPSSRRDFGRLFVGVAAAGALGAPLEAFAASKEESKETLKCRAVANNGAAMGGTECTGVQELEFTRAFETKGTATKLTGDKDKLSTYYSQINAGYLTLVDLEGRWDQYVASGDGDVIRRRIGTVGSKSPLHNIRKVFEGAVVAVSKNPDVDPETFDELDELFNGLLESIFQIDYNLYSTAFVGTQEIAGGLRVDAKGVLEKAIKQYKRFLDILEPLNT